jgi:hypothetical protein
LQVTAPVWFCFLIDPVPSHDIQDNDDNAEPYDKIERTPNNEDILDHNFQKVDEKESRRPQRFLVLVFASIPLGQPVIVQADNYKDCIQQNEGDGLNQT